MPIVNFGSEFCRDCGDGVAREGDFAWCTKEDCRPLGHTRRNFCEHCGIDNPGPGVCPRCGEPPLGNR